MTVARHAPMPIRTCSVCGQPLRAQRGGVFLSPLKAALWDAILAAGDLGASTADLMRLDVWRDRKPVKPVTVRMHIMQINDVLAGSPWRIVSIDKRYVIAKLGGDRACGAAA